MVTVSTKIDEEMRAKLQEIGEKEDFTISLILRKALKAYIENYNKGE